MKLNIFIEKIKAKHVELEHKNWSWSPFYNGALEAFSILNESRHETEEQLQELASEYSDNLTKGSGREFTHNEIVSLQLGFKAGRLS